MIEIPCRKNVLSLSFPGEPKAVQSFRFTREGHRFQNSDTVNWKGMLRIMTLQQLPTGWSILDEPIGVDVDFVFSPIKSLKKPEKEMIAAGGFVNKGTKPDLTDNLMKGLCDALTTVVWRDDALISRVITGKVYGAIPGISMTIFTLGGSTCQKKMTT